MQKPSPLPMNFYEATAWHKAHLNFYDAKPQFPSKDVLGRPTTLLTKSVASVIDVYGDYPETVRKLLKQTINPLYDDNEYEELVYLPIKSAAIEDSQPRFNDLAESLLAIRLLFHKNMPFISKNFSDEISKIDKPSDEAKASFFLESIRNITNAHVTQVIGMIEKKIGINT